MNDRSDEHIPSPPQPPGDDGSPDAVSWPPGAQAAEVDDANDATSVEATDGADPVDPVDPVDSNVPPPAPGTGGAPYPSAPPVPPVPPGPQAQPWPGAAAASGYPDGSGGASVPLGTASWPVGAPAQAGPGAPVPPGAGAPVRRSVEALELAHLVSPAGLVTVGLVLLAAVVPALVSGILLSAGLEAGNVPLEGSSLLQRVLVASGVVVGGMVRVNHEMFSASVSMLCLGPLTAIGALTAWVTRRRAPDDSRATRVGPVLLRSAAEGLLAAVVTTLVTGLGRVTAGTGSSDPLGLWGSEEMTIAPSAPRILLLVLLVATVGAAVGRLSRLPASSAPAWWWRCRQIRAELAQTWVVLGAAFGAALLVVMVGAALDDVSTLLVLPIMAPNLVVAFIALGTLGGLSLSASEAFGSSEPTDTVYAWSESAWGWLLVVLAVLALVVVALRVGVRRQRLAGPQWTRVWQLPTVWLIVWVPVVLLAVSGGLSVSSSLISMRASLYPSVLALVTAPLAVALASAAAEVLPAVVYQLFPRVLQVLVGRQALQSWLVGAPQGVPAPVQAAPAVPGAPVAPPAAGVPAPAQAVPVPAQAGAASATSPAPLPGAPATGQPVVPAQSAGSAAAAPGVPPLAPPPPLSPSGRRRVRLGLLAVAVLALAVIAGVVAVHVLNSSRTPEAAAREYVELIASGQADAATALVDPGVPNDERGLLTDAAMAGRTSTMTVEEVKLASEDSGDSGDSGDSSTVMVDVVYQVDGERRQAQVEVSRKDNSMLVLHEWEVSSSLAVPCEITAEMVDSVMVGQATIEMGQSSQDEDSQDDWGYGGSVTERTVTAYAYPGTYTVSAPEDLSSYVTMDDVTLDVGGARDWGVAAVSMTVEASPELEDKVLEAVASAVESCASVPGNMDSQCPYSVQRTDLQSLTVTSSPTEITEMTTSSFTSGQATITIKPNPTQWNPDPDEKEVDFVMVGTIDFDDKGEPTITVEESW